eukprot:scaffold13207_cov62-Phaeocystis_antarctica.AAC.6
MARPSPTPCRSIHRRGGRVASVALATSHRPFRSAGTAPRSRGLDLAGARFALSGARMASPGSIRRQE